MSRAEDTEAGDRRREALKLAASHTGFALLGGLSLMQFGLLFLLGPIISPMFTLAYLGVPLPGGAVAWGGGTVLFLLLLANNVGINLRWPGPVTFWISMLVTAALHFGMAQVTVGILYAAV